MYIQTADGYHYFALHMSLYADLYFVVLWLGEEEKLYDTVPARQIVSDGDVLNLEAGTNCKAMYDDATYCVEIIAKGKILAELLPSQSES